MAVENLETGKFGNFLNENLKNDIATLWIYLRSRHLQGILLSFTMYFNTFFLCGKLVKQRPATAFVLRQKYVFFFW